MYQPYNDITKNSLVAKKGGILSIIYIGQNN